MNLTHVGLVIVGLWSLGLSAIVWDVAQRPGMQRTLCEDALQRRRQAEAAMIEAPVLPGESGAPSFYYSRINTPRLNEAQGVWNRANEDQGKFCR